MNESTKDPVCDMQVSPDSYALEDTQDVPGMV